MNRPISLGLAMVAASVVGAAAANGMHEHNNLLAEYAVLDPRAINTPDVFKTLPFNTGDFDGHTA
jgi:hypothetical protein